MNTKTRPKGVIMLLLTAFIWGTSFVAQSVGMEKVDAFTFNGIRTLMGAAFLLPFILISDGINNKKLTPAEILSKKAGNKKVIIYGIILGTVLCAATNFQQHAFIYSSSGKIAFITAMYMIFVPMIGLIFRKKITLKTWMCIIGGFVGLFLLCINPADLTNINKGDLLSLICAIIFAIHILLVEKFAPDVDGIKLSCIQFATSGTISCILMFIFETPQLQNIYAAMTPLLYSGIMSCGVAYTLQIIGQKYTESSVASLLLCMESVFAVIVGAIVLQEMLTIQEAIGCFLMFTAIILSQIHTRNR